MAYDCLIYYHLGAANIEDRGAPVFALPYGFGDSTRDGIFTGYQAGETTGMCLGGKKLDPPDPNSFSKYVYEGNIAGHAFGACLDLCTVEANTQDSSHFRVAQPNYANPTLLSVANGFHQ